MNEEQQKPDPEWLESQFFSQVNEVTKLYAIIDGQWCKDIYGRLETYKDELTWTGLIAGEQAKELALTSPYLIRLEKGHKLTKWLLDEGWGQGWGIYFHANTEYLESYRKPPPEPHKNQLARSAFVEAPGIEEDDANDVVLLRRHFRKFQRVEFEDDGRLVRFRFFDPAVLRIYLLTCNAKEIDQFFGSAIAYFISEDYCEEPGLCNPYQIYHYYRPDHGELIIKKYNWLTKQAEQVEQLSASKEEAEFPNISIIPQIRNGQIKIFERMQLEIFKAECIRFMEQEFAPNIAMLDHKQKKKIVESTLQIVNDEEFEKSAFKKYLIAINFLGINFEKNPLFTPLLKKSSWFEDEELHEGKLNQLLFSIDDWHENTIADLTPVRDLFDRAKRICLTTSQNTSENFGKIIKQFLPRRTNEIDKDGLNAFCEVVLSDIEYLGLSGRQGVAFTLASALFGLHFWADPIYSWCHEFFAEGKGLSSTENDKLLTRLDQHFQNLIGVKS